MREQILIFQIRDSEMKSRLTRALLPLRVRVRAVAEKDYGKTIGEIAGVKSAADIRPDSGAEEESVSALSDPMMVFAGFTSARLDAALRSLRSHSVKIPYKAVLTESNASWTPAALLAELKKEHAATHPDASRQPS